MTPRKLAATLMALALWLAAPAALAAKYALVMGNGAYAYNSSLPNAQHDADAVAAKLREIGFRVTEGTNLDRAATLAMVQDFVRALAPGDLVLFYYAGHGAQIGQVNYLIPVDARIADAPGLAAASVSLDSVLTSLSQRADTRIIILDACRNNPFVEAIASRAAGGAARGLARMDAGVGSFIAFSTQPGNVALDGEGHNSPFTGALVRFLGGPGDDVHATMRKVRGEVSSETGGVQVPWENSSLVRQVYLGGKAAPAQVASVPATPAPVTPVAPVVTPAPAVPAPAVVPPTAGGRTAEFHYVDGLDPYGDNFLALKTAPRINAQRIAKLGPGTLLQVLDSSGDWRLVRLLDGRTGWAHGRWIYCCRPANGSAGQNAAASRSCDDLWYARNAIWHRYGYCFRSARGQAAFDTSACFRTLDQARAAMVPADARAVGDLVAQESAQGCR